MAFVICKKALHDTLSMPRVIIGSVANPVVVVEDSGIKRVWLNEARANA